MEKKLNKEQLKAIRHGSGSLLVIAGAGTGKTTVITERIKYLISKGLATPEEILALTFTEKASQEMEERIDVAMPLSYGEMWIMTFHSFCDRILRDNALHIGLPSNYKLMTEAESIDLIRHNMFEFELDYFRPLGNPNKFIDGLLKHFSRLQDETVTPGEYLEFAKKYKNKEELEVKKTKELANAYKAYDSLKIKEGKFDFGDLITKTIQLFKDRPNILKIYRNKFKYILIDEFQDTNYAQNQLAILLSGEKKNITVVADDDQCLPPNTLISTPLGDKKIKDICIGDKIITAVGKGHTSISKVKKIFKSTKNRKLLVFKTEDGKELTVTNNHKMFCFIPSHYYVNDCHFVYLMNKQSVGWRVGVTNNLPSRLRLERGADIIIGIGSYRTDDEARFYEAYYSAKYGIPTVPFSARPTQAISGVLLDKLFNDIDTESNVKTLANDLRLELDSPQFLAGAVTRGATKRVKINFMMCYRNYVSKSSKNGFVANPTVLHKVSLETSNKIAINKLLDAGFVLSVTKKGRLIKKSFAILSSAWEFAVKLQNITNGIIDKKFSLGKFNYQHLPARIVPASHIFNGMFLPVLDGKKIIYQRVVSRIEKEETIKTYDLEIDKTHNFIANEVVVHNSIYRFRGASVSNIVQFRKYFPKSQIVVLSENYRSRQAILDSSYGVIQRNNPDRLEVVAGINKKLSAKHKFENVDKEPVKFIHTTSLDDEVKNIVDVIKKLHSDKNYEWKDFAVLVRANSHSDPLIREFEKNGIPYQFLGPNKLFDKEEVIDLISYLKVLYNVHDTGSFYRLISSEIYDISPLDLIKITNYARKNSLSIFEVLAENNDLKLKDETKTKIVKLFGIIDKHLKLIKNETAGFILYDYIKEIGLFEKLLKEEDEIKTKNVTKFFEKIKNYEYENKNAGVIALVDYLDLLMEVGESPIVTASDWQENNAVNILTVHSSKGLEFKVVFLINLVSLRFPSTEKHEQIPIPEELIKEMLPQGNFHLQEERRLFYVGMTRAKEKLYLTASDFYADAKRAKKISPFVFEALEETALDKNSETKNKKQIYSGTIIKKTNKAKKTAAIKIDFLSVSQIETFQICPLHYKLRYIYKLPTEPTAALSFGVSIHNTMRDFYKGVIEGAKPTKEFILNQLQNNWIGEGYKNKKHKELFLEKGKKYLTDYLKNSFNKSNLPIMLEEKFNFKLGINLKIGGTFDRIDRLPGGGIEIIDYKTGETVPTQKELDKDLQLGVYALAASKIHSKLFSGDVDGIKLSLYYFEGQQKITTRRTKKDLDELEKKILEVKNEIENSDFKCSNHYFCQMGCEFPMFCKKEK